MYHARGMNGNVHGRGAMARRSAAACLLALLLGCGGLGSGPEGAAARPDVAKPRQEAKPQAEPETELKCLKACKEWGENCISDSNGVLRCHRVCNRFGTECYEVEPKK